MSSPTNPLSRLVKISKMTPELVSKYPHVRECWVLGVDRVAGDQYDIEEVFEIRAEWADSTVLVLRRNWQDLIKILKKLRQSFPEEIEASAESLLIEGLCNIRATEENDTQAKLDHVENFLRTVVSLPSKYSQSEAVLSFFEASHVDLMIGNKLDPAQLLMYSPVTTSEIRGSNGYCLANTETILCDTYFSTEKTHEVQKYEKDYEEKGLHEEFVEFLENYKQAQNVTNSLDHKRKTDSCENPVLKPPRQGIASEVYISKMAYLHMDAHETDILE